MPELRSASFTYAIMLLASKQYGVVSIVGCIVGVLVMHQ